MRPAEVRDTLHVLFGAASPVQGTDALCVTLCSPPAVFCNHLEVELPCRPQGRASVMHPLCTHCCTGEDGTGPPAVLASQGIAAAA